MIDYFIGFFILGIIATIVWYLYKTNKKGQQCIGCPYAKQCAKKRCHH